MPIMAGVPGIHIRQKAKVMSEKQQPAGLLTLMASPADMMHHASSSNQVAITSAAMQAMMLKPHNSRQGCLLKKQRCNHQPLSARGGRRPPTHATQAATHARGMQHVAVSSAINCGVPSAASSLPAATTVLPCEAADAFCPTPQHRPAMPLALHTSASTSCWLCMTQQHHARPAHRGRPRCLTAPRHAKKEPAR